MSATEARAATGAWRVVGAAAAGAAHRRDGRACDDALAWRAGEGTLAIAVADGAGSAPRGGEGARVAADVAAAALHARLAAAPPRDDDGWREAMRAALAAAREALEVAAARLDVPLADLATTLVLAAAADGAVAAAQVGDGAVVVRGADGAIAALTVPRTGEYLNETTFLSADDALDEPQVAVRPEGATHIAALSDGLQMLALAMPAAAPHAPFFEPLFRFASGADDDAAERLAAFLAGPRVATRTDDDVTLVLAAWREAAP